MSMQQRRGLKHLLYAVSALGWVHWASISPMILVTLFCWLMVVWMAGSAVMGWE